MSVNSRNILPSK